MRQYTVPQFIDIEDKIIGPITVRQFLIMLFDGLLIALIYRLADFSLFVILGLIFGTMGVVLAFVKINGQPFHYFLLNLLQTSLRPALRVWDKSLTFNEAKMLIELPPAPPEKAAPVKERATASKLSELSLVVNTGGAYKPEEK
jgi:hypothetical protein